MKRGFSFAHYFICSLLLFTHSISSLRAQSFIISSGKELPNRGYLDGSHHINDLNHEQRAMHAVRSVAIKDLLSIRLSLKKVLGQYLSKDEYAAPQSVRNFYIRNDGVDGQTIMEVRDLIGALDGKETSSHEGAMRELFERFSVASWAIARLDAEIFYLNEQVWKNPHFEKEVADTTQSVLNSQMSSYPPNPISPRESILSRKKKSWSKDYGIDKRLGELLGMRIALLEHFPFLALEVKVQKGKAVVEVPFYQCLYGIYQKIYGLPVTNIIQEESPLLFTQQDAISKKNEHGVFNFAPKVFNRLLEEALATQVYNSIFPFDELWADRTISDKFKSELVRLAKLRLKHNTQLINDLLSFKKWEGGAKGILGERYTLLVLANSPRYWQMTREHYRYLDHLIHWESAQSKINSLHKSFGDVKSTTLLTLKVGAGVLMGASLIVSIGSSTPFVIGGTAGLLMGTSAAAFVGASMIEYYDASVIKDFTLKTFYGSQGVSTLDEKNDAILMNDQAFRSMAIQMILLGVPSRTLMGIGKLARWGVSSQTGTKLYSLSRQNLQNLLKLSRAGILKNLITRTFGNISHSVQSHSKSFIDKIIANPKLTNQFAQMVESSRPGLLASLRVHDNPIIRQKLTAIYSKFSGLTGKLSNAQLQKDLARELSIELGMSVFLEYTIRGEERFWKELPFVITNTVASLGIVGAITLRGSSGSVRVNMWSPAARLEKYDTSRLKVYRDTGLYLSKTTFWSVLISAGGVELYNYFQPENHESGADQIQRVISTAVASSLLVGLSSGPRAQAVIGWFQPRFQRIMHKNFGRIKGGEFTREGMWWLSSVNNGSGLGMSILLMKTLGIQEHEAALDPNMQEVLGQTEKELENSYVYQNDISWEYAFGA